MGIPQHRYQKYKGIQKIQIKHKQNINQGTNNNANKIKHNTDKMQMNTSGYKIQILINTDKCK